MTSASNISKAIKYAKDKGYSNSEAHYENPWYNIQSRIYNGIKTEIDADRPIILNATGHTFVGYGYSTQAQVVRVNLWWGKGYFRGSTEYYNSRMDYNIGSLYYNGKQKGRINSYVTFKIQN